MTTRCGYITILRIFTEGEPGEMPWAVSVANSEQGIGGQILTVDITPGEIERDDNTDDGVENCTKRVSVVWAAQLVYAPCGDLVHRQCLAEHLANCLDGHCESARSETILTMPAAEGVVSTDVHQVDGRETGHIRLDDCGLRAPNQSDGSLGPGVAHTSVAVSAEMIARDIARQQEP
jgi:hypothetical protein